MPTDRERFCAKSFDRFLAQDIEEDLPCWKPVTRGEDPPDFYLTLGDETFAVEVTSTPVQRQPAVGEVPVIEETYIESHREIARSLEDMARTRGLAGHYALSFAQPVASEDFSKVKEALLLDLVKAVTRSQSEPVSWSEDMTHEGRTLCWLLKVGGGPIKVNEVFGDTGWIESPEFRALVTAILHQAIARKKQKLEAKAIPHPAILLLLNTYLLADPRTVWSCLQSVAERSAFHSIFLVQPDGTGMMIHSEYDRWLRVAGGVGAA